MKESAPILITQGPFAGLVGYYRGPFRDTKTSQVDLLSDPIPYRKLQIVQVETHHILDLTALVIEPLPLEAGE